MLSGYAEDLPPTPEGNDTMNRPGYRKPPWLMRTVGNRLAPLMNRSVVARLSVPGRVSGQVRTNPIAVLEHDGQRYLIAPYGRTDWALNLRASGRGRLIRGGRVEEFVAVEIPPRERPPLIEAYRRQYGRMPKVAASLDQLPDPADHPTFQMVPDAAG